MGRTLLPGLRLSRAYRKATAAPCLFLGTRVFIRAPTIRGAAMPEFGPARQNFQLWRGDDLPPVIFRVSTEDDAGVRTPVNLTGYEILIKVQLDSGDLTIDSRQSGTPIFITTPAGGSYPSEVHWFYGPSFTALLPVGRGVDYEVKLINPSGQTQSYLFGQISAKGEIGDDG
jgi:hypothetical protein